MEGLQIGRVVHFVAGDDEVYPAIVTKVIDKETGSANLTVFVDDVIVLKRETSRLYSETGAHGTWHWPPRN